MRVAVLGFGKVAETTHLPGFASTRRPFDVVAVAEPSADRRARAAELLPHARVYEHAETLLERERGLDLSDVAAPPFLHARLVLASLRAGLHVLCEKPLALDPDEISRIVREASAHDRVVFTVNNWRHAPPVAAAIDAVQRGELGRLAFVGWSVRRTAADPGAAPAGKTWREDPKLALGGILVDHGWHALTALRALIGSGKRAVSARLAEESGRGDVEARVRIEQEGCRSFIRLTWRATRRSNRVQVLGERGRIRIEDDRLVRRSGSEIVFPEKLSHGSIHPAWFPPVLEAFVAEVESRGKRGEGLAEATYCASTIRAAYESAARGGEPVLVD